MLCKNGNMNEEPDERLWHGLKGKINELPQDMAAVLLFWDANIMDVTL